MSRYQGIAPDLLEVIPAKPTEGLYDVNICRRVAVYARVSTDDLRQTSSYELQPAWYKFFAYEDSLKDDMFVEKVGRSSPREIGRIAKERKAGSMGYAEAMLTLYNKKSSSNGTLKWARLYESKQIMYKQGAMQIEEQVSREEVEEENIDIKV